MIEKIVIRNFKSLKKVSVDTTNLNLLMGLNGMGKSSLIQSLLMLLQSDKLDSGELCLNGDLVRIGQGRDALYQFAEDEQIEFEYELSEGLKFLWIFFYNKEKEKLYADAAVTPVIASNGTKAQEKVFHYFLGHFQYIGADRNGPRDIYDASSVMVSDEKQIGLLGQYAAHFINTFGFEYDVHPEIRHVKANSSKLNSQVDAWMGEISPGVSIHTKYVPEVNKVILDYQFDFETRRTNAFRPINVGYGISYVLPIVLALLTAEEGRTIIIENPESHIHPRGQAELGKLISLAASTGAQLFVETHSDHVLNGIRVAVKEHSVNGTGGIHKSKVKILYFNKVTTSKEQYSKITSIEVDQNGTLSEFPKDFLDEWSNQLSKLM